MTVSCTSATPAQPAANARAADGDYKTKGVGHDIKDADGDYKQTKAAPTVQASSKAAATASSSSAVLGAVINLPKGGA